MLRTTTTISSAAEPVGRRSSLVVTLLPISLLLIGCGLSPFFTKQTEATITPAAGEKREPSLREIAPSEKGIKQVHRMVALDMVERLEKESRESAGNVWISPLDLRRLRNALESGIE
jgi:hypothetical protein